MDQPVLEFRAETADPLESRSMTPAESSTFSKNNQHVHMIRLEQMPPFLMSKQGKNAVNPTPNQIETYLLTVLEHRFRKADCPLEQLFLPSIAKLAPFLNVSVDVMLKALKSLKMKGYDCFATGKYGMVSVWPKAS